MGSQSREIQSDGLYEKRDTPGSGKWEVESGAGGEEGRGEEGGGKQNRRTKACDTRHVNMV